MILTKENVHIIQTGEYSFALIVTEVSPQEGVIFPDYGKGILKKDSDWIPVSPYQLSLKLAVFLRDELTFEDID